VITARRTRLFRVPDLHAFRSAIAQLAREPDIDGTTSVRPRHLRPSREGRRLVLIPTRAAARQIQPRVTPAECVTREELYDRLHARLADPPRRLTAIERDVIFQAAARAVAATGVQVSFRLRPGLVAEMLRFYDQLRRQSQHVTRFEELIEETLGSDELDQATARMRAQTQFLAGTFREYERRVRDAAACDEHLLRDRLVAEAAIDPVQHIVVTVPDWIGDEDGLYVADFDLLARIPGLESLDIVATEAVLGSGFHERLHSWLPGIEEETSRDTASRPVLMIPPDAPSDEFWWTCRDREEELVAFARQLRADQRAGDATPLDRRAIVFKRPLPYLYLAAEVFGAAAIPYQTAAALPLATEPAAAAIDLVLDAVASRFTRSAIVALLRSPHFAFRDADDEVTSDSIGALDRALSEARYLGDPERLAELASDWRDIGPDSNTRRAGLSAFAEATADRRSLGGGWSAPRLASSSRRSARNGHRDRARPALHASLSFVQKLEPLASSRPASEQLLGLSAFWSAHTRPIDDGDPFASRERRARAAIADLLSALASVHAAQEDPVWSIDDLAVAVRRAIEEQTFVAESAGAGVHLVDDQAARYGDFDTVTIVGVIEPEWPDRPRRNIFYPPSVLKSLGWPSEKDRRAAADARFLDLLGCASAGTAISTFTLEDDALVSRSVQLDEIPRARLSTVVRAADDQTRVFVDEALTIDPPELTVLGDEARAWVELRVGRAPADSPDFHGAVQDISAPVHSWSVSAIETYLDCPFKFFAQHVLKLEEEPDDEEVMDPRRQGQFVHEVFERFFAEWQEAGHRAITRANLAEAGEMFTAIVDRELARLPPGEAGLERTRLLGSPAAAGLGDAVLRMEAERPIPVVERLLERTLEGDFTFSTADGPRTIALRGKADRLDLLEDGTFRLIDYKLGWPPNRARALQLPIYGLCAEQRLASHRNREWRMGEAVYLAFKGPRRVVPLFSSAADRAKVLAEAQQRLADAVDAIARGEFPPRPDDVYRCDTCSFAAVCRKDYVGDV